MLTSCDGDFELDFNLFIVYNFYFVLANGDFFYQLRERRKINDFSNKNGKRFDYCFSSCCLAFFVELFFNSFKGINCRH
jgi:hypothetical protein